jgi:hypothetical protein
MADATQNEQITAEALARLPGDVSGLPNWEGLVTIVGDEVQEAEAALYSLIVDRSLAIAAGVNLDQYGEILSEPRDGLTDTEYRRILGARILSNRSDGQAETLIGLTAILTGSTDVRLFEVYPAGMVIAYVVPSPLTQNQRDRAVRIIRRAVAAGVRLDWIVEAGPGYFGWLSDPDAQPWNLGLWSTIVG